VKFSDVFKLFASKGRALTVGEVALARSVFGDEIDYERVRLFQGGLSLKITGIDGANAPDGNIYFVPSAYREDFSSRDINEQAFFIHEMTHVWQHQHGVNLVLGYLREFAKHKGDYVQAYILPEDDFDFKKYNIEQQARTIENAFYFREFLKDKTLLPERRENAEFLMQDMMRRLPPEFGTLNL